MSVLSEIREEPLADGVVVALSLPVDPAAKCPQWIVVMQSCGKTRLVPVVCSDPLCVPCSKVRAARLRAKWEPVLKKMHAPRFITLTMKSGFDLQQVKADFQVSFRRLLDLRLGRRGLDKLLDAALDFVRNPSIELPEQKRNDVIAKAATWEKRIELFRSTCERKAVKLGRSPRMRDVIGPGFAAYHVTWSDDCGWHFHRHLTTDGAFMPWPVLVAAWKIATKGDGQIVDIRAVEKSPGSIKELINYAAKAWDIPPERAQELRLALFGLKRVWPLGGAKPSKQHGLCPFCKQPGCKAHKLTGIVQVMDEGKLDDGTLYRQVWDDFSQVSYLFVKTGGVWAGLQSIGKGFACQSLGP